MTPNRSRQRVHAPPRVASARLALFLVAAGLIVAACGGSTTPTFGAGDQTVGPGESTMESAAPTGY